VVGRLDATLAGSQRGRLVALFHVPGQAGCPIGMRSARVLYEEIAAGEAAHDRLQPPPAATYHWLARLWRWSTGFWGSNRCSGSS
jgi:hypothetical protein